jgi:hypothetical protein
LQPSPQNAVGKAEDFFIQTSQDRIPSAPDLFSFFLYIKLFFDTVMKLFITSENAITSRTSAGVLSLRT